jgi:hypothetical protein
MAEACGKNLEDFHVYSTNGLFGRLLIGRVSSRALMICFNYSATLILNYRTKNSRVDSDVSNRHLTGFVITANRFAAVEIHTLTLLLDLSV